MDKDKSWIVLLVIGVVAAYLLNLGGIYDTVCGKYNICIGASGGTPPSGGGGGTPPASDICIYDGAVMTLGPMKEKWNPATDVTDRGIRVFVNGVDRGIKADGSTLDVNYKDTIELYYAENDTAGGISYYTAKDSFVVPCTSAFSTADKSAVEELFAFEGSSNALAFKAYCEDDGLLNSISTTEDLGAGDVITIDIALQPTYEDAWSPYCDGIVVLDGNSTSFDNIIINGWAEADIPSQHKFNATHYEGWAYYVPEFSETNGAYNTLKATMTIDASTLAIGAATSNVNVSWYDCDWYRDSNTGEMKQGVEDNTNADVGGTNYKDTLFFT